MRVSTTVDAGVLQSLRSSLVLSDSELLDRALRELLDRVEAEAERVALLAAPYDEDPDLAWSAPISPLAYDADVPPEVIALAQSRRRRV
jgi:hypothetical protein